MIERGLITRLLDFFLGDKSPVRPADAPVEGALGNTVMQPKYFHLLNAAMKLIQCATTRPTGDAERPESPSPTTAPRESPLVPAGATLVPLSESDVVLLHSQVLYTHAMQDGLYADQVCEIMAHMMWEDKDFTALSISVRFALPCTITHRPAGGSAVLHVTDHCCGRQHSGSWPACNAAATTALGTTGSASAPCSRSRTASTSAVSPWCSAIHSWAPSLRGLALACPRSLPRGLVATSRRTTSRLGVLSWRA